MQTQTYLVHNKQVFFNAKGSDRICFRNFYRCFAFPLMCTWYIKSTLIQIYNKKHRKPQIYQIVNCKVNTDQSINQSNFKTQKSNQKVKNLL